MPETRLGPKPVEDAFYAMNTDISNLEHPPHNTKFTKERMAIKEMANDHNIIINKADKGSTIVLRHKDDYI